MGGNAGSWTERLLGGGSKQLGWSSLGGELTAERVVVVVVEVQVQAAVQSWVKGGRQSKQSKNTQQLRCRHRKSRTLEYASREGLRFRAARDAAKLCFWVVLSYPAISPAVA